MKVPINLTEKQAELIDISVRSFLYTGTQGEGKIEHIEYEEEELDELSHIIQQSIRNAKAT